MVIYQLKPIFYIQLLWSGERNGRAALVAKAKKAKKDYKLILVPVYPEQLKELQFNTIPQVTTGLSYVLKWAKMKQVIEDLPQDHKNVMDYFKALKKLSPQKFQPKKFKDLWDKHDMEEITNYTLVALGVADESDHDDNY